MPSPLPRSVSQLAAAIADGEPVDWAAVESSFSDPRELLIAQRLRLVAEVADLHLTGSIIGESLSLNSNRLGDPGRTTLPPGTIWGHLKILKCVGRGRFGVVYRALDTRLDRDVALKLLDRDIVANDSEVIHEGRMMARIHHANVTAIYGAESRDGQVGLWMQFVEGRTLEAELRANGIFGADDLRQVASELCDALGAVHRAGLVHRDVKPQNVLRDPSGRVILGDFGAGRFSGDSLVGVAGTPLYLAPEVIDGGEATEQSDIYSLGVVLFHLATGGYPIFARTIADMRDAHASRPRVSLAEQRPDLAGPIAQSIDRALCADASLRPTLDEFKTALQGLTGAEPVRDPATAFGRRRSMIGAAAAAVITAAVALTTWFAREPGVSSTPLEARPWVLVAAFDNRTGDAKLNHVLENALQRELVESAQFRVASRSRVDDVLRLMRRPVDAPLDESLAREIALRDGAIRHVIGGHVDRLGSTIVLSASILDVDAGTAIASLSEEAQAPNGLQSAIRRLSNALRLRLGETEASIRRSDQALQRVTTPSLRALRLYSESYAAGERDQWPAALNLARAAVQEDATFAAAHTWLAWCLVRNQKPRSQYVAAATMGLDLSAGASDWERLWVVGSYHALTDDSRSARSAYEALLRIYPDHYWAANNLVINHRRAGRDAEALAAATRLVDLRPQDHNSLQLAFDGARRLGQFDLAADYAHRIRALGLYNRQPGGEPWVFDATLAWDRGQPEAQIQELRKVGDEALSLDPELRDAVLARVAMSWLAAGRPSDGLAALKAAASTTDRRLTEATIAHAVDDGARAAREALATEVLDVPAGGTNAAEVRQWALATWIVSRTTNAATVHRFYRRLEPSARNRVPPQGPAIANVLAAELARAQGDTDEVVRRLAPQNGWNNLWDLTNFQAAETVADAFITRGDLAAAARELEEALLLKHPAAFDAAYWQMRCQLRLAEILSQLGKASEASAIARELEQKLRHAEPGFPLANRVTALLNRAH